MSELMTTTYSMWRLFRNCRMACKWRYIDEVVRHAGGLLEGSTIGEDARQAIDNLTDALLGVGGEA